jgi:uncharacterized repeat protein (TIGR01451 family)
MRLARKRNGLFRGGLAAALLVVAPLVAASGLAASAPPPSRWTAVPNNIQVVALWDHSQGLDQRHAPSAEQPTAAGLTLISKSASPASVAPDGTLHYAVTLTNATRLTQTFQITDTLPAGLAYITNTASGGFVYNAISSNLTATLSLTAFHGDVITATGAPPYTEISSTVSANICQTYFSDCDNSAITLAGVPFRYLGVDYNSITLDSNGFVMPGSGVLGADNVNQNLPDVAAPNNVIAPFWSDLDLDGKSPNDTGGGDWWYGVLHDNGSNADYLVVEWHHAQKKGDAGTDYTFQVWVQLHVEHITFAYATPAFTGDTSSATVGFENSSGTLGNANAYLYNGAGQVPASGDELQLVANFDVAQLGFDVKGLSSLPGCATVTNTADLALLSGTHSATATTATFGPCLFLPLINR